MWESTDGCGSVALCGAARCPLMRYYDAGSREVVLSCAEVSPTGGGGAGSFRCIHRGAAWSQADPTIRLWCRLSRDALSASLESAVGSSRLRPHGARSDHASMQRLTTGACVGCRRKLALDLARFLRPSEAMADYCQESMAAGAGRAGCSVLFETARDAHRRCRGGEVP
jgi:hypothetical protein